MKKISYVRQDIIDLLKQFDGYLTPLEITNRLNGRYSHESIRRMLRKMASAKQITYAAYGAYGDKRKAEVTSDAE